MKVTSSQAKPLALAEPTYPCLMESREGLVVMFYKSQHGIVVYGGETIYKDREGIHRHCWGMNFFGPYHGTVTITS